MCDGRGRYVVIEGDEFRLRVCKCKGAAHFIDSVHKASIRVDFYKSTIKSFNLELYEIEVERNIAAYAKRAAAMYVERWMDFKSANKGLFFHSVTSGSGKTKLAISTLIALMKNSGFNGKYVTEGNLVTHLEFTLDSKEPLHITMNEYISVSILLIDDFALEKQSKWTETMLFQLLDARMQEHKLTLIVS